MANNFYPSPDYYFQLQFEGIASGMDNAFQEASGLTAEREVEEMREGGQNQYKHRLPTVVNYSNLVLKRGFVGSNSALATWCNASLASGLSTPIQPLNVVLSLLGADGTPLAAWSFREAWPVKWRLSDSQSQENALAIETLEFTFSGFQKL